MPTTMILRGSEILAQIAAGKCNAWIVRNYGHGRSLIREICAALGADLSQIFVLHHAIRALKKVTAEITARIDELTSAKRTMLSADSHKSLRIRRVCRNSQRALLTRFGTSLDINSCRQSQHSP
jgi:hypothetical protein